MAKQTPLQEVKERFGSKTTLADKLIDVLECDEGVEKDEFERRVRTASNKQLLRLHEVHETVSKGFGSKEGLVKAIVDKRFPKGNDNQAKLLSQRPTRLLDLYRSL